MFKLMTTSEEVSKVIESLKDKRVRIYIKEGGYLDADAADMMEDDHCIAARIDSPLMDFGYNVKFICKEEVIGIAEIDEMGDIITK